MNQDQMLQFARDQLQMGEDSSRIVQQLVDRGVDQKQALRVVEAASNQVVQAPGAIQPGGSLVPAVLGGLLGAVLGGGIWALVVVATEYEIGFMAWGIGALCGFAVLLFARGRRGKPLQVIAVVSSLLGIFIGKYGAFYYVFKNAIASEWGEKAAEEMSLFSPEMLDFFVSNLDSMVTVHDLLWVVLAVVTAWSIPRMATPQPPPDESASLPE